MNANSLLRLAASSLTLGFVTAAAATIAHADTERLTCHAVAADQPAGPGALELTCTDAVDTAAIADRTHVFVFPTGNTVGEGEAVIRAHGLGIYNQVAVGITDSLEINAAAPVIPVFASVGARLQLMPTGSSTRLTISGGLWMSMMDDDSPMLGSASATLAHQTKTTNVHATVGGMGVVGDEYDDESIAFASVGIVHRSEGSKHALFAEIGQIGVAGEAEHLGGAAAGIKLMGKRFDADLGVLIPFLEADDDTTPVIPMLSLHYRFN